MELWKVIITAIVSNAVALGILGFLFKSLIGHFLDKDINSYKSKLDTENLKLQITYSGIFNKQADAILDLYAKLLFLEQDANPGMLKDPGHWNNYKDRIREAASFYHEKRIMIPARLDEKVLKTIEAAHDILANSTNTAVPSSFADDFRKAKEATLIEMRRLLSIAANEQADC